MFDSLLGSGQPEEKEEYQYPGLSLFIMLLIEVKILTCITWKIQLVSILTASNSLEKNLGSGGGVQASKIMLVICLTGINLTTNQDHWDINNLIGQVGKYQVGGFPFNRTFLNLRTTFQFPSLVKHQLDWI